MLDGHETMASIQRGVAAIMALRDRGAVWDCDLEDLRRNVLAGRPVSREEADALFDVECARIEKCPAWTAFFVEVITDHVVWEARPTGVINQAKGEWVIARADQAASLNGLAVLVNILAEAHRTPLWFLATVRARAACGWEGVAAAREAELRAQANLAA